MQNIFNQAFGQQPGGYVYGENLGDTSQNAYNLWGSTGPTNPYIARAATQAPLIPQNVADVLPGGANYYDWDAEQAAARAAEAERYAMHGGGGGGYYGGTYSEFNTDALGNWVDSWSDGLGYGGYGDDSADGGAGWGNNGDGDDGFGGW